MRKSIRPRATFDISNYHLVIRDDSRFRLQPQDYTARTFMLGNVEEWLQIEVKKVFSYPPKRFNLDNGERIIITGLTKNDSHIYLTAKITRRS